MKWKLKLIRIKWLNLIKQVNRKLINGINWKTPKYEEIIGRRISPLHAGNTFCCIYVHLFISYANLFFVFLRYNMGYHIPNDFQSHLVQSMIKLRPHTLHMYWLLVFGSRVLGPWDPTFGSYNNTRCWLMQRLFCSDIGHSMREDTNPVSPVVQESQFFSVIDESRENLSWTIFLVFLLLWCCLETPLWTIRTVTLSRL